MTTSLNLLHQLTQRQGLTPPQFVISMTGSMHNPTYHAKAWIRDRCFEGHAKTKQLAKQECATVMLEFLRQPNLQTVPSLVLEDLVAHPISSHETTPVISRDVSAHDFHEIFESQGWRGPEIHSVRQGNDFQASGQFGQQVFYAHGATKKQAKSQCRTMILDAFRMEKSIGEYKLYEVKQHIMVVPGGPLLGRKYPLGAVKCGIDESNNILATAIATTTDIFLFLGSASGLETTLRHCETLIALGTRERQLPGQYPICDINIELPYSYKNPNLAKLTQIFLQRDLSLKTCSFPSGQGLTKTQLQFLVLHAAALLDVYVQLQKRHI